MEAESEIEINHSFINNDLKKLLINIATEEKQKFIHLSQYTRYGFSKSNLFLIYFSREPSGSLPYLLKTFEDKVKFKIETEGMEQFKHKYSYAQNFKSFPGKLSGILLENFNKKPCKIKKPKTFANIMYETQESEVCRIINKTYKEFNDVNREIKTEYCNIKDKYLWYLRDDKTRDILNSLTDDDIKKKKINFYRQSIINPVYILDNLEERIKTPMTLIHGDLHQNNIVINDENNPRIVDFAWSFENDIYIDFSLFEMSVRYFKPNCLMDYRTKNELEEIFLSEDIDNVDIKNQKAKRMIAIVREIRKQCKKYTKAYDFNHYLLSQFLVLYGLQTYTDTYNPFLVIPFLAKLGDKLIKFGYVKEI